MKISILCCYYNRPNIIRLALQSIRNQQHDDWELIFVDDGSEHAGKPIVEEILHDRLDKVKFFNTENSKEEKEFQGGSLFGMYWTEAMYSSDADIAIMLCDDDALYGQYLSDLSNYYEFHSEVIYSYGHVSIFNPTEYDDISQIPTNTSIWLNNHRSTINPYHTVDASQVSWRIKEIREAGIKFPFPQTINLDASLYEQLFRQFGGCVYNGMVTQYKGWHKDQLEHHKENPYNIEDM